VPGEVGVEGLLDVLRPALAELLLRDGKALERAPANAAQPSAAAAPRLAQASAQQPTTQYVAVVVTAGEASDIPERELTVGVRAEGDFISLALAAPGAAPGVFVSYRSGGLGFAGTLLLANYAGLRGEVRFFPVLRNILEFWASLGVTGFIKGPLSSEAFAQPGAVLGLRGGFGFAVLLVHHVQLHLDLAGEFFPVRPQGYYPVAINLGGGVGYSF
jgi:hypothetical protein